MRFLLLIAVIVLSSCNAQQPEVLDSRLRVSGLSFDYTSESSVQPRLPKDLANLTYETQVIGYGVNGKVTSTTRQTPTYALPINDGYLLGGDRGEWGGELVFRRPDGSTEVLLNENVQGIFQTSIGIVVFTGLAHMGINDGAIYLVNNGNDVKITSSLLHKLPGSPSDIYFTHTQELVFRVVSGRFKTEGSISRPILDCYVLSTTGSIRQIPCATVVKA